MRLAVLSSLVLLAGGCTTLPSCAWGKCASPRTFALAPQTSERVYPLRHDPVWRAVKEHLERRGYPLAKADPVEGIIITELYAEKPFARFLGIDYHWEVQIRKMDSYNTAVTPKLFVHEEDRAPRFLSAGLWPEPYRYFYYEIEKTLRQAYEQTQN